MGEYEPHDSRKVTLRQQRAPGEPPRTGPREGETRQPEQAQVQDEDDAGLDEADGEAEAALRERSGEDEDEARNAAAREDRND